VREASATVSQSGTRELSPRVVINAPGRLVPALSFRPVSEQIEVLLRGAVDVITRPELEERLEASRANGVPLKVKAGFDPTRPDLHMGHAVVLRKMKDFQDLGHHVVLVVGGFTAMLGDPSGQNELRPRLTREEVAAAAETYTTQAFKILDRAKTEIRNNTEWIDKLDASRLAELMSNITVARMLERNDFAQRFAAQKPIYQHEFLYPLLQAYDSVALGCDIELGGTDQLFNLLVGRDIMPRHGQRGQMVMTTPLLEGTDARIDEGRVVGKKMSKSADNYIGLQEEPLSIFRKVMQVDDALIFRYFELLSARSSAEIAELRAAVGRGRDPREVKALFADEWIKALCGNDAATKAAADFAGIYAADAIPDDVPSHDVRTETPTLWIAKALSSVGLVKSTGEGKRLVEQGGVEVDRVRVTDANLQLMPGKRYLVRVGSKNRRFAYIAVSR
jgi:tyrosyl-tRNA synthetase